MQFKKLTPNVMVSHVNEYIEFYITVLGFEVVMSVPETGVFDWVMIQREGVTLMVQSRASLVGELPQFANQPSGGGLTFYLDVANVTELYDQLHGRANIIKPLFTTFYGRQEFAIQDSEGFILVFAGSLP